MFVTWLSPYWQAPARDAVKIPASIATHSPENKLSLP